MPGIRIIAHWSKRSRLSQAKQIVEETKKSLAESAPFRVNKFFNINKITMKKFVGTKIVLAEPMNQRVFLESVKGQDASEIKSSPGYKVQYEDGYISWSPSDIFERCYREITDQEINMIIGNDLPVKNY